MTIRVWRDLLLVVLAIAITAPVAAQSPEKPARIGFLAASSQERERPLLAAFRQAMRERGYRDGATFVVENKSKEAIDTPQGKKIQLRFTVR